jgi:very-short-patch-repair endonuclease
LSEDGEWWEPLVRAQLERQLPSLTQLAIFNLLQKHFEHDVFLLETQVAGLSVDIYLPNLNTIIEVDGPQHFLLDGRFNGATRMKHKMLAKLGYVVHSVTVVEFQKLNETEQIRSMANLARQILYVKIAEM